MYLDARLSGITSANVCSLILRIEHYSQFSHGTIDVKFSKDLTHQKSLKSVNF